MAVVGRVGETASHTAAVEPECLEDDTEPKDARSRIVWGITTAAWVADNLATTVREHGDSLIITVVYGSYYKVEQKSGQLPTDES